MALLAAWGGFGARGEAGLSLWRAKGFTVGALTTAGPFLEATLPAPAFGNLRGGVEGAEAEGSAGGAFTDPLGLELDIEVQEGTRDRSGWGPEFTLAPLARKASTHSPE